MRLVHDQHEIVESGEIVEIALADLLPETTDAGRAPSAHLGVYFRDVEDVDRRREQLPATGYLAFVVVAGRDDRWRNRELRYTLQHVFGVFGVKSVISLL